MTKYKKSTTFVAKRSVTNLILRGFLQFTEHFRDYFCLLATDSIFSESDMSGKHAELSNGEFSLPVIMEVKGKGELASFRAKTYMMREEGKPIRVYGRHACITLLRTIFAYGINPNFLSPHVLKLSTRSKTKNKAALSLPLGFWSEKPVKLTRDKVSKLLQADLKRARETYDSFSFFENKKSVSSEPYVMDDILHDPTFDYPPKSNDKFPFVKINRFSTAISTESRIQSLRSNTKKYLERY